MQAKSFYKPFITVATLIILYLSFKFIVPVFFPFLISAGIALLMHPLFHKYSKRLHISPTILSIGFTILFFSLTAAIIFFLGRALLNELKSLTENIAYYENSVNCCISSLCSSIGNLTGINAADIESSVFSCFQKFIDNFQNNISSNIFSQSFSYMKILISLITLCFITFISFVLWVKDYDTIQSAVRESSCYAFLHKIYVDTKQLLGTYLKAQLIILLVICTICVIGLFILKNPYALLLGIGIGLMDAMPFLGTGCVFIPCSIFHLFQADFFYAAVYLTLYLITALSREILEPRLIGNKFGIPSILILIAIYTGIELFGLAGVLLGPLYFLLSYEIIDYFANLI